MEPMGKKRLGYVGAMRQPMVCYCRTGVEFPATALLLPKLVAAAREEAAKKPGRRSAVSQALTRARTLTPMWGRLGKRSPRGGSRGRGSKGLTRLTLEEGKAMREN